jgi:uncharacterized C2H2 Zn-finger protein
MTPSKGIIPRVIANKRGEFVCGDCGKPWKSAQSYSMHWHRKHGGMINSPRKKSKYLERRAAIPSTSGILLDECPCCHLPLGPVIEGIKRALEERMKRHANES